MSDVGADISISTNIHSKLHSAHRPKVNTAAANNSTANNNNNNNKFQSPVSPLISVTAANNASITPTSAPQTVSIPSNKSVNFAAKSRTLGGKQGGKVDLLASSAAATNSSKIPKSNESNEFNDIASGGRGRSGTSVSRIQPPTVTFNNTALPAPSPRLASKSVFAPNHTSNSNNNNSSKNDNTQPIAGYACENDGSHTASVICLDCSEKFCKECDDLIHSRKKFAGHNRMPIPSNKNANSSNSTASPNEIVSPNSANSVSTSSAPSGLKAPTPINTLAAATSATPPPAVTPTNASTTNSVKSSSTQHPSRSIPPPTIITKQLSIGSDNFTSNNSTPAASPTETKLPRAIPKASTLRAPINFANNSLPAPIPASSPSHTPKATLSRQNSGFSDNPEANINHNSAVGSSNSAIKSNLNSSLTASSEDLLSAFEQLNAEWNQQKNATIKKSQVNTARTIYSPTNFAHKSLRLDSSSAEEVENSTESGSLTPFQQRRVAAAHRTGAAEALSLSALNSTGSFSVHSAAFDFEGEKRQNEASSGANTGRTGGNKRDSTSNNPADLLSEEFNGEGLLDADELLNLE
jgi:hypothetical protein